MKEQFHLFYIALGYISVNLHPALWGTLCCWCGPSIKKCFDTPARNKFLQDGSFHFAAFFDVHVWDCLRCFPRQSVPHPSAKKRAAWVRQARLSAPPAHGQDSLIAQRRSRWACSAYHLQPSPARRSGCFWTSPNYPPSLQVRGFRCGWRNNRCYLPFLVPRVGARLRWQCGRIVLRDICGSAHRAASRKMHKRVWICKLPPHTFCRPPPASLLRWKKPFRLWSAATD